MHQRSHIPCSSILLQKVSNKQSYSLSIHFLTPWPSKMHHHDWLHSTHFSAIQSKWTHLFQLSISGYNNVWILLIADFQCSFPVFSSSLLFTHTTHLLFRPCRVHTALFVCRCSCHISFEKEYKIIWFDLIVVWCAHDPSVHQFNTRLPAAPSVQFRVLEIRNVVVVFIAVKTMWKQEKSSPTIQLDNYFLDRVRCYI